MRKPLRTYKDYRMNEGGAYGHLEHPFDNRATTFAELNKLINAIVDGDLTKDNLVQTKTDGQNLMFSWKDGKLISARNGSHLKNAGAGAMTIDELKTKFQGRGEITKAFSIAIDELNDAISSLSQAQRNKIFDEGKKFMSVEVIYPGTTNVVPYGQSLLVFHGTNEYDAAGDIIGQDKHAAKILAGMIKQVNKHVQDEFFIRGPEAVKLKRLPNSNKKKSYYRKKLVEIGKMGNVSLNNTISEYLDNVWMQYVNDLEKKLKVRFTDDLKQGLVRRWAHNDKSYSMNMVKQQLNGDMKTYKMISSLEKDKSIQKQQKNFMIPIENLFLELGTDVLINFQSALTLNPTEATNQLRDEINKTVDNIYKLGTAEQIEKMKFQLDRIEHAGGLKNLNATEGITFYWNGTLMKLPGLFTPINQLLGILKYV